MNSVIQPLANFSLIDSPSGLLVLKHDFATAEDGSVELKAGISIEPTQFLALAKDLVLEGRGQGFIPSNLIYEKSGTVAWLLKSKVHTLMFNVKGSKFNLTTPMPNLVFIVKGSSLNVVAVLDDEVTPDTELYHAPLFNFYDNASMCTGSVKRPDLVTKENLVEWENMVFKSYFSHSNHSNLIAFNEPPKDVSMEYIRVLKVLKNETSFPVDLLSPKHVTLKQFIEE